MTEESLQLRWARYAPLGAALLRIGASSLLAYVFLIVMMTAIAQADVVKELEGNYSAQYQELARQQDEAGERRRTFVQWRASERAREAAINAMATAQGQYDLIESPVRAVVNETEDELCHPADRPGREAIPPHEMRLVLVRLASCLALLGPALKPSGIDKRITAVLADQATALKAATAWRDAVERDRQAKHRLADTTAAYRAMVADYQAGAALRRQFAPILLMRDHWLLGGSLLVQFPPAMMQMLIAFVSGAFGALLLALVLIVYPNNGLGLTKPGGNYGERILLGGLIAVCVAIVLGGGSAVLGTADAAQAETMNFQAFSAIGILAGMFADRVAQWLSDRAQNFYGSKSGDGGPGEPPPPSQ